MDPASRANRIAWEQAHQERVWANGEMLTEAAAGVTLVASEHALLRDILAARPLVVHPQSGNGQDDVALVDAGARTVIGVDSAGLEVRQLEEYAEPFWRMGDVDAAAFRGRLPNAFALPPTGR